MNNALADEIIGILTGTPERHDQRSWIWPTGSRYDQLSASQARVACGTTACVAGWAALLTLPDEWALDHEHAIDSYGVHWSYADIAEDALGLTPSQANWLFSSWLSRDEVLRGLKYLQDDPGADGDELERECADTYEDDG